MGNTLSLEIELEEFILLLIVLISVGVVAGHYFWPQTVIEIHEVVVEKVVEVPYPVNITTVVVERKIQIVEIPKIIYQTNYTVIEIPIPYNQTQIVEVPVYLEINKVRDFEDMEELFSFIQADKTDEIEYSSNRFNCMDFAITTSDNALKIGYRVIFLYSYNLETKAAHAVCMAYVQKDSKWMVWEPQTDEILWGWLSRITDGVN